MLKEVVDYNVVTASFLSPVTKKRKYREYFALLAESIKSYYNIEVKFLFNIPKQHRKENTGSISCIDIMKRIINYISQNKASYFPEALILDVYKLSGLSFILLVSSPLLVISGLKNLATITLSLSIVVLIITLYRIYITYFGKWVLIKATCISIPKQSKLKPKFINTKNMVVQVNHEKPTETETFVIPIGISNNNFTEGMHLDIYISASTPVYKKNGLTVVSGTLKIVPKEQ